MREVLRSRNPVGRRLGMCTRGCTIADGSAVDCGQRINEPASVHR
jgi:hypothetical protein